MKLLFFHGGPGLHSVPESQMFRPFFERQGLDIRLWNEPSSIRNLSLREFPFTTTRAFSNSIASAEAHLNSVYLESKSPVHLIGHSFGALIACLVAQRNPSKISALSLIAPGICTEAALRNVIAQAAQAADAARNSSLSRHLLNSLHAESLANPILLDGAQQAFLEPSTSNYYWNNLEAMETWNFIMSKETLGVDWTALAAVLKDAVENKIKIAPTPIRIPTQVIFGKHDRVIVAEKELEEIKKTIEISEVFEVEGAAHFVQLEQPEQITYLISSFHLSLAGSQPGLTTSTHQDQVAKQI